MAFGDWGEYVSAEERRKRARAAAQKLARKGRALRPVAIEGRKIANTFWGRAWCDNLERYSDFASRMPRGRSYARNGSVIDLQIAPGRVTALVSGSELYEVDIAIARLPAAQWRGLVQRCAGQIGSTIELLQGKLSAEVMGILAQPRTGLFPSPEQIELACSCPDWAEMCKHVAAALYGVGARLDQEPEIFFTLRQVDQAELITEASSGRGLATVGRAGRRKTVAADQLASIFGIELDASEGPDGGDAPEPPPRARRTRTPLRRRSR